MQTHKATIYDKRGNILSIGYNSYTKSHPYQAKLAALVDEPYKIYLHAEIQAIVNLRGGKPYHFSVHFGVRFALAGWTLYGTAFCKRSLLLIELF